MSCSVRSSNMNKIVHVMYGLLCWIFVYCSSTGFSSGVGIDKSRDKSTTQHLLEYSEYYFLYQLLKISCSVRLSVNSKIYFPDIDIYFVETTGPNKKIHAEYIDNKITRDICSEQ